MTEVMPFQKTDIVLSYESAPKKRTGQKQRGQGLKRVAVDKMKIDTGKTPLCSPSLAISRLYTKTSQNSSFFDKLGRGAFRTAPF